MNEDKLKEVLDLLTMYDIWEGEPSLLTEEATNKIIAIKGSHRGCKRSSFHTLVIDRLKCNLIPAIFKMKECVSAVEDKQDLLVDLYLRHEFYEHLVNKVVEELEGGICSYDKASYVLDSYENYLRKDKISQNRVCKVTNDTWINYCISLGAFSSTGNAERIVETRLNIIEEYKESVKESGK